MRIIVLLIPAVFVAAAVGYTIGLSLHEAAGWFGRVGL